MEARQLDTTGPTNLGTTVADSPPMGDSSASRDTKQAQRFLEPSRE